MGIGYALSGIFGFLQGSILAFIIQIIAFYFYNNNKISATKKIEEEHLSLIESIYENSLVDIVCPCGVENDKVPYFDLVDRVFVCDKCSSKYRVEGIFSSVLLTEPVNLENAFNKIKNKEPL